jgi:hypothetical protein
MSGTLANAAVELPERDHPARRVIEAFKTAQRHRIIELCSAAELAEPEMLADELFLLLEGARVSAQSMGRDGLGDRLIRMGEAMMGTTNLTTLKAPILSSCKFLVRVQARSPHGPSLRQIFNLCSSLRGVSRQRISDLGGG